MKMQEKIPMAETKHYVICPHCGEGKSEIDHLLDHNTSTRWYCNACGGGYNLEFRDSKMYVGKNDQTSKSALFALRNHDVFLVVEGLLMSGSDNNFNSHQYFYEEHTCPENFLERVVMVGKIHDTGDIEFDPHGLFEYLGQIPCGDYMKLSGGNAGDAVKITAAVETWLRSNKLKVGQELPEDSE